MRRMLFQSTLSRYIGVVAALVGVIGYAVFGWRFGGGGLDPSSVLGAVVAAFAILWLAYRAINRVDQ
jgi:hypothetical protein